MNMRPLMCLMACALLAGCASSEPRYPNDQPKNVTINLHYESGGGFLSSSQANVGINAYAKDCSLHYKGWVKLSEGRNKVGLPIGQPVFLDVDLSGSSFGGYVQHDMQRGVLITPRRGVHYEVDVNYVDDMFDIRLYERTRAGKRRLDIRSAPRGCPALH